jgi:putative thioredoxin
MSPTTVFDVDQDRFQAEVIDRSHEVPVVVDLWAAWCGPCRTLGPMLEDAVAARDGEVVLAKLDVDANPGVSQALRVQGIPAVKAFRDGRVVAEFTGAVPRDQIEAFLDRVVPSAADRLAAASAQQAAVAPEAAAAGYREALELDPSHRAAAIGLAELVVEHDPATALELVRAHRPDPAAEAVATRAELTGSQEVDVTALERRVDDDPADGEARLALARAYAARRDYVPAIDHLLEAVRNGGDAREPAREQLIALFGVLGDDDERVRAARPRLASALF